MTSRVMFTRQIPQHLETLRVRMLAWYGSQERSHEYDRPGIVSYVGHCYTNYTDLVDALPPVSGHTKREVLESCVSRYRSHRSLWASMLRVVALRLDVAYDVTWKHYNFIPGTRALSHFSPN